MAEFNVLDLIEQNTFIKQPDGTYATPSGMIGQPADPVDEIEEW